MMEGYEKLRIVGDFLTLFLGLIEQMVVVVVVFLFYN